MKLAAVFMIGSISLFALSAAEAKERDHRRAEGNAREQRTHVVRDARNRSAVPTRSASTARDERHDNRASNRRDERQDYRSDNRSDHRRDDNRRNDNHRDVQRVISDRDDRHSTSNRHHHREGDIRREERHTDRHHDSHRNDDHRRHDHRVDVHRHDAPRHSAQHRIVHDDRKHTHKKHYHHHHHGHTIVRREHYVRHNLVSLDNFWDGIFLGAIYHAAYHDGMFCRNRFHDHYRTHYYWEDELGYCYRVEPGIRRDRFIEVPQYMCY